jgi:hypothetical protein
LSAFETFGDSFTVEVLKNPRRNQKLTRSWIRTRLPKGQLNIPEEKKIGNNQALEPSQKWPKTNEKWPGWCSLAA